MSRYLIKLKPLEPYFFGDENTIRYDNKNLYYVSSLECPSATTIMGMLRYTVLEQNNCLFGSDNYKERSEKLIGKSSFTPTSKETSYGCIKSVSPLFIVRDNININKPASAYVKLPQNHSFKNERCEQREDGSIVKYYTPMTLSNNEVLTSHGKMSLPAKNEFDAKKYVGTDMYLNLSDGSIENDMFTPFEKITNSKYSKKEGFLKKIFKTLKEGFSFAIIANIDCDLKKSICYMGRERCGFTFEPIEIDDSFKTPEQQFKELYKELSKNKKYPEFKYALSDIVLKEDITYTGFSMVSIKNLRYLTTNKDNVLVRSPVLHNTIEAGSVFYDTNQKIEHTQNCGFGINNIITAKRDGK